MRVARSVLALLVALISPATALAETRDCLVSAARAQIGVTLHYDGRYERLAYPGGDVPIGRGVCTDVLIRAYRALGIDLQKLVHEDMARAWETYPKLWGLTRPDRNIDHRRVPNLATFFSRHGSSRAHRDYQAGDLVTWRLPSGVPHIGIVSERRSERGRPLILHNIGSGAAEDDVLDTFEVTGHYRYFPAEARCAD
jgi:uncharacterized protein YijF (DUF1287 family)